MHDLRGNKVSHVCQWNLAYGFSWKKNKKVPGNWKNHQIIQVRRDHRKFLVQPLAHSMVDYELRLLRALSRLVLKTFKCGGSTSSRGNLFQSLAVLMVKKNGFGLFTFEWSSSKEQKGRKKDKVDRQRKKKTTLCQVGGAELISPVFFTSPSWAGHSKFLIATWELTHLGHYSAHPKGSVQYGLDQRPSGLLSLWWLWGDHRLLLQKNTPPLACIKADDSCPACLFPTIPQTDFSCFCPRSPSPPKAANLLSEGKVDPQYQLNLQPKRLASSL